MIQPQRIGRFLSVDESGYVEPDVAIDHIGRFGGRLSPSFAML